MIFKTTYGFIIGEVPDDVGMEIMEKWRNTFYENTDPITFEPVKYFSLKHSVCFLKKEVENYYTRLKINKTIDNIIETL